MLLNKVGIRSAGALGMLMVAVGAANAGALAPQKASADSRMTTTQGSRMLAARSARFVENKGQWDARAMFLARSRNLELWFTDQGIRYDHYVGGKGGRSQAVDMSFVGGGKAVPEGRDQLRVKIDYFLPGMSARNVGAYGELLAKGVLPGVDMRSYFDQQKPRYDLIVAPGANARTIKLRFTGANGLSVAKGELHIGTKLGGFANGKPLAYQLVNGKRVTVASNWKILDARTAGFDLGKYDPSKPLVIDPLIFGTYFGGNTGADEVRAAIADADKNVYFTGSTRDARFPVLNRSGFTSTRDSEGLNINSGTGAGQSDAFVSRISGDAYRYDYSAFFGGTLDDFGQFIKFDQAGNVWVAGTTASSDFPLNDRGNVQFLFNNGPDTPNGDAQFRLVYGGGGTTAALPYNATPQQVLLALRAALGTTAVRSVTANNGGTLPFDTYRIELAPDHPFPVTADSSLQQFGTNAPISQGLSLVYRVFSGTRDGTNGPRTNPPVIQVVRGFGSNGETEGGINLTQAFGTYTLSFTDQTANPQTQTTGTIQARASGAAVAGSLNLLTNLGTNIQARGTIPPFGDVSRDPDPTLPGRFAYAIAFFNTTDTTNTPVPENLLRVNSNLRPQCTYGTRSVTDIFVLHLNRNTDGTLTPSANPVKIFGSDQSDELTGFDVWPNSDRFLGAGNVIFAVAGTTIAPLKFIQGNAGFNPNGNATGFVLKNFWNASTGFREVVATGTDQPATSLPYVTSPRGFSTDVRGVVFDQEGGVYIAGNLSASGNYTASAAAPSDTSNIFYVTNGIFTGGKNVRNQDAFVRKYNADGSAAFSGVLGGEDDDTIGGIGSGLDGQRVNTGSPIAIDRFNNVYVTGVSRSFNFPRTLGVFGPIRTNVTDVFVTKIDATGSSLLYSTMLNTNPGGRYLGNTVVTPTPGAISYSIAEPAGIAVDGRGYAYVTGNLRPSEITFPITPGDPNQPSGSSYPSITLAGANDATYDGPTGAEFPTIEPFLTILNPTATGLALSTYLGGFLDDFVYAPSVTPYGDVFTVGWTDSIRGYTRVSSTGTPTVYITGGSFPLITNLAVKQGPDQSGGSLGQVLGYGLFATYPTNGRESPRTVNASYGRDGFIAQFRIDAASVQNLTFNPTSIPGGLGAFTTGTVTLSQAVGSGGGQIVITLPNGTATASLQDPSINPDANTLTISVAEGATSATFPVYSKGVTTNVTVPVRATFEGTFKEAAFQVVPYLQRIQLSDSVVVGGNNLRGTVTLSAPAPAGGAQVTLTITPGINGGSVPANIAPANIPFIVPEGQTSAQFDIQTTGVDDANGVVLNVTAAMATVVSAPQTAVFTVFPAQLQSLTLGSSTVAKGNSTTAFVTLNGQSGPGPTGAGYAVTFTASDPSVTITPSSTFVPYKSSTSPTVTIKTTAATPSTVIITATHTATSGHPTTSRSTTLTVASVDVASFTIDPTSVASGGTATGTITLQADVPSGGALVPLFAYLSQTPPTGKDVPSYVTVTTTDANGTESATTLTRDAGTGVYTGSLSIASGKTATFKIKAGYTGISRTVVFGVGLTSDNRIAKTATLTIAPIKPTITFSPSPVVGGTGSTTMTISLPTAPTVDIPFHITANSTLVPSDFDVVLGAGQTSVSFPINVARADSQATVTFTVTFDQGSTTGTLVVKPIGLLRITPKKAIVRGGGGAYVFIDAFFSGPLTAGTYTVSFTSSQPNVVRPVDYTFTVPAGGSVTQITAQFQAFRVSRSQDVTITAQFNGDTASTSVTITR